VRFEGASRRSAALPLKTDGAAAIMSPFVPVPVPTPEVLPVRTSTPAPTGSGDGGPSQAPVEAAQPQPTPERLNVDDAALQVTIRQPNTEAVDADPAPVKSAPLRSVAETPVVPVAATASGPVAATPAAHVSPVAPAAPPVRHTSQEPPAPRSAAAEEPIVKEPEKQALKSVSLEFSPDGAGDVRLRVSERAGEVHISLHTSDPSLSGRIHEGVHDLVGTLTHAGYDAEAWTPGQGGGKQQQEQQRRQPTPSPEAGDDEFGGIYEPLSIQEIS
jgi:hypothetical protein